MLLSNSYQRRQWHPTPVLLPGKSHGLRSLVGYSPWGCKESDRTERLHIRSSWCDGDAISYHILHKNTILFLLWQVYNVWEAGAKLRHDEIWLVSKLPGFKSNKGYWFIPYIPVFIEEFLGSKVSSCIIYTTYWTRCLIKIKHCHLLNTKLYVVDIPSL